MHQEHHLRSQSTHAKQPRLSVRGCFNWTSLLSLFFFSQVSYSWDRHTVLMPMILNGASPETNLEMKSILERSGLVPCESEDQTTFTSLIQKLDLNPVSTLPPLVDRACGPDSKVNVGEILTTAIDDPDLGKLDQNLPKEISSRVDPNNDRPFMGGIEGPTSQGFRHMYFGGWKGKHPVITFQIPPRAIGQAPYRFETLALYAKNAIRSGNLVWGTRTLGWAMHYIQDLTQPFHSVQAISKKMVPWSELLTWPPKKGFENLVKESTRIITNYHWAYEGYVRDIAKKGQDSPFYDCLVHPEKYSELKLDLKAQTPIQLAFDIAKTSIPLAPDLGSSEIDFFGKLLLQPGVDFTKNVDMINNIEYASRPDLQGPRGRLHDVTCRALANTALGSRLLIQWAFQN